MRRSAQTTRARAKKARTTAAYLEDGTVNYLNLPAVGSPRSCEHCERAVSDELTALAGVEAVAIDLDSKIVQISGMSLDDAALRAAVVEAGYEPE